MDYRGQNKKAVEEKAVGRHRGTELLVGEEHTGEWGWNGSKSPSPSISSLNKIKDTGGRVPVHTGSESPSTPYICLMVGDNIVNSQ